MDSSYTNSDDLHDFYKLASFLNRTALQFSSELNSSNTRTMLLNYDNTTVMTKETLNKTVYEFGEYIHVYPSTVDTGNKDVNITYYLFPYFVIVSPQNGSISFKEGIDTRPGTETGDSIGPTFITHTLTPNKPTTLSNQWSSFPQYFTFWANQPGRYTVSTVSDLFLDVNGTCNRIFLWSNPTPITVLSENDVQNGTDLSQPLKQFKSGTLLNEIICKNGFTLLSKTSDNSPACVKPDTAQKLVEHGWGTIIKHFI